VAVYNTTSENSSVTTSQPDAVEQRMLIVDISRQILTLETLNHLLKLAMSRNLRQFIVQLAWGQNSPHNPSIPAQLRKSGSGRSGPSNTKSTRFQESDKGVGRQGAESQVNKAATEGCPSMHVAQRVPKGKGYSMLAKNGTNVLDRIHAEWDRMEHLSDLIRRGQYRGANGSMIRDVVVIGRGVAMEALQFVYAALLRDERASLASRAGLIEAPGARLRRNLAGVGGSNPCLGAGARRLRFLSSIDPVATADAVSDLDPASTLVISIALQGNEETGLATKTIKSWLLKALTSSNRRPDQVLGKHMLLVTGNDQIAAVINKPESVFLVPDNTRCEAFTTFTAVSLLPLSVIFGWPIVLEFLSGAHDLDVHFIETNPRHNLPVLLALTDTWNDVFLRAHARTVTPFTEAFAHFPRFAAALEAQACGSPVDRHNSSAQMLATVATSCSSLVVDGGLGATYDRVFYQGSDVLNLELVMAMDTQVLFNTSRNVGSYGMRDLHTLEDAQMCALFAQADELAFGSDKANRLLSVNPSSVASSRNIETDRSVGNRPSSLLICGKLDAFSCGQLIALSEHRAAVKAHIWGVNPFVQEIAASLRSTRTNDLKAELQTLFASDLSSIDSEEDFTEEQNMHLSTKTILKHYVALMREKRSVKSYSR
jgi:glucose-6-phosphate isomerase